MGMFTVERRKTKQIMLGDVPVGGGAPVTVQSMTNTDTGDAPATLAQILELEQGVQGIRINPGTIGKKQRVREIAREAATRGVAVRVGVNAGSLERSKHARGTRAEASALAESALEGAALMQAAGVENIKISVKASDVTRTIEAYRLVSEQTDWPLHVGVTEAGTLWSGTVKSAVGIGALLAEGIGLSLIHISEPTRLGMISY